MCEITAWDRALYLENFGELPVADQQDLWTLLRESLNEAKSHMTESDTERLLAAHQLISASGSLGLLEASHYFRMIEQQKSDTFDAKHACDVIDQLLEVVSNQLTGLA